MRHAIHSVVIIVAVFSLMAGLAMTPASGKVERPENLISVPIPVAPIRTAAEEEHLRRESVCLAQNVYFEARGESKAGQRAVAHVVMNRAADPSWPSSVCEVVHQAERGPDGNPLPNRCEFSWYCDGKPHQITDIPLYLGILEMSRGVVYGTDRGWDLTEGSVFFHTKAVDTGGWPGIVKTVTIDNHVFYRKRDIQHGTGAVRRG